MQRKFLPYHTPTYEEVEHTLYVAFREDADALRNHTLPHRVPAGSLVFLRYWDGLVHYTFFRPATEVVIPKTLNVRRELDMLASNRSCYLGWEGMSIGPTRLTSRQIAILSKYDAHTIAGRISNKTVVDDAMTALLNERLYRLKEAAA